MPLLLPSPPLLLLLLLLLPLLLIVALPSPLPVAGPAPACWCAAAWRPVGGGGGGGEGDSLCLVLLRAAGAAAVRFPCLLPADQLEPALPPLPPQEAPPVSEVKLVDASHPALLLPPFAALKSPGFAADVLLTLALRIADVDPAGMVVPAEEQESATDGTRRLYNFKWLLALALAADGSAIRRDLTPPLRGVPRCVE